MTDQGLNTMLQTGFDPNAMIKINLDTQRRMDILLNNPGDNFNYKLPDIPNLDINNYLYSNSNNINIQDFANSDNPDEQKLYSDYMWSIAANKPNIKYNWGDPTYKETELSRKAEKDGYFYDFSKTAEENESRIFEKEQSSSFWPNWFPINIAKTIGKTVGRAAVLTGTKFLNVAATGSAYIQSLWDDESLNTISSIADNYLVRQISEGERSIKDNFLSSYKDPTYQKMGFFSSLKHPQFWTDEASDFIAFQASSYLTGRALGGLGKAGSILQTPIKGLAGKGLQLLTGSKNLAGVAGWAVNTANEAAVEAASWYRDIKNQLQDKINPETGNLYTDKEIQRKQADGASMIYNSNLAILAFSNSLENRWVQRGLGKTIAEDIQKKIVINQTLEAIEKQVTSKTAKWLAKTGVGKRALYYGPEILEGLAKEGYWEENAQTAITRLADQKFGTGSYLKTDNEGKVSEESINLSGSTFFDFFNQYFKQTGEASTLLGGSGDIEASKAIGSGGLIAAGGTILSNKLQLSKEYDEAKGVDKFKIFKSERKRIEKERLNKINKINEAKEKFTSFKDVFDENGNIDSEKLRIKLEKASDINTKMDLSEDITNPLLKESIQKGLFSEYVLSHLENSTFDQFIDRFSSAKSDEELALFGFDKNLIADKQEYINLSDKLKENYNKVQNLQFVNSDSLNPFDFKKYENLLKSRIFDLYSKSSINEKLLDKYDSILKEEYGEVYQDFLNYKYLTQELENLNNKKDEDGSLSTQKEIIRSQLKNIEDSVNTNMDILEEESGKKLSDKFSEEIKDIENLILYSQKINKNLNLLIDPISGINYFKKELNESVDSLNEPIVQQKEVIKEDKIIKNEEIIENQKTVVKTSDIQTESVVKKTIPEMGNAMAKINNLKKLDEYYESLTEEEKKSLNYKDGDLEGSFYNDRKYEIINKNFNSVLDNPDSTKKQLNIAFSLLPSQFQEVLKEVFEERLKTAKDDLTDDKDGTYKDNTIESIDDDKRLAWESPIKSDIRMTNDSEENDFIEILESDDKYMLFISSIIPTLTRSYIELNDYVFFIENDEFNVKKLPNFEEKKGVIIRMYKRNELGENIPLKVSDLTEKFKSIKDQPVIFSMDTGNFTAKKFKKRVNTFSKRKNISTEEARDILLSEEEEKNKARNFVKTTGQKVEIQIESNTDGVFPLSETIVNVSSKFGKIQDISIDNEGFITATVEKGYKVTSFLPNLLTIELGKEINSLLSKTYESQEQVQVAISYINNFIYTGKDSEITFDITYNEVSKSFNLGLLKSGKKLSLKNVRLTYRKELSQEGYKNMEGKQVSASEYDDFIFQNLVTNYKVVLDKEGDQFFEKVNPYFIFKIDKPEVQPMIDQRSEESQNERVLQGKKADIGKDGLLKRNTSNVDKSDNISNSEKLEFSDSSGKRYIIDKSKGWILSPNGMPIINVTQDILETAYNLFPFDPNNKETTVYKMEIPMNEKLGSYYFYSLYGTNSEFMFKNTKSSEESLEDLINSKNKSPETDSIINEIKQRYC